MPGWREVTQCWHRVRAARQGRNQHGMAFSFLFPVDVMLLLVVDGGCAALQARKTPQTDTDTTDGSLAADT